MGVGLAALNTGNNLMYMVLSLLLSFLVLSGVLSESALRGIRVRRRVPGELFAERASPVVIEIRNDQRRVPAFAIVVEDLVGGDLDTSRPAGRVFALRIAPGGAETRSYPVTPAVRGSLSFAGVRVATRFPFGLFSKAMLVEAPYEVCVYPPIDPAPLAAPASGRLPRDEERHGGAGASPESAGLREWRPGETSRRVHWRASLRRGALLVREPEREDGAEHTVLLRAEGRAPGPAFESQVRRAASELVAHLEAGFRVGLHCDSQRFEPASGQTQRRALLGFLARVEAGGAEAEAA
jgi:uncharacterized protein (DUF58 family)